MKECPIARSGFLEPHQNLPKPISPRMDCFHHTSAAFDPGTFLGSPILSPGNNVGDIDSELQLAFREVILP